MKALLFLCAIMGTLSPFAREKKIILHSNGKIQYEYEMEGFKLDGRFTCYYENGRLRIKGQFAANQKTGLWRFWDEKGRLRAERNYRNNLEFTVISEFDSTGEKLRSTGNGTVAHSCEYKDYLFSHRYLSAIHNDHPANAELFGEDGPIAGLMKSAVQGNIQVFTDDRFEEVKHRAAFAGYDHSKLVSLLVKETYYWCAKEQTMNNKVLGLCPVASNEKGEQKELGWFYVADINLDPEVLRKLQSHEYASVVRKTTAMDVAFKLKEVSPGQNDLLRLMLIEFEANAILYTIDYDQVLATNQ